DEPDHQVEALLAFVDLSGLLPGNHRFDQVVDILDVQIIPRYRRAIGFDLQLTQPARRSDLYVFGAAHLTYHIGDLAGGLFERVKIITEEFDRHVRPYPGNQLRDS